MMKLSRNARRNAALVAGHGPARRATYCHHWQLTLLACVLHTQCPDAAACADYQDAVEYHEARCRRESRLLERREQQDKLQEESWKRPGMK